MFQDKCGCLDMYFDGKAMHVIPVKREKQDLWTTLFFWNKTWDTKMHRVHWLLIVSFCTSKTEAEIGKGSRPHFYEFIGENQPFKCVSTPSNVLCVCFILRYPYPSAKGKGRNQTAALWNLKEFYGLPSPRNDLVCLSQRPIKLSIKHCFISFLECRTLNMPHFTMIFYSCFGDYF